FDTANAPPEDAEPVDHRRMGVGTDQRIGERHDVPRLFLAGHDDLGQVFEVHLVHDTRSGGHHAKIRESLLRPLEETVTLLISFELSLDVGKESVRATEEVYLHRMV